MFFVCVAVQNIIGKVMAHSQSYFMDFFTFFKHYQK